MKEFFLNVMDFERLCRDFVQAHWLPLLIFYVGGILVIIARTVRQWWDEDAYTACTAWALKSDDDDAEIYSRMAQVSKSKRGKRIKSLVWNALVWPVHFIMWGVAIILLAVVWPVLALMSWQKDKAVQAAKKFEQSAAKQEIPADAKMPYDPDDEEPSLQCGSCLARVPLRTRHHLCRTAPKYVACKNCSRMISVLEGEHRCR